MPVAFGAGPLNWEETFTYSDGTLDAVSGGNWGSPAVTGDQKFSVTSGAVGRTGTTGWGGAYSTKSNFGDGDLMFEFTAWPGDGLQVLLHMFALHAAGEGGVSGMSFNITKNASANDRIRLQRWNASAVQATHIDNTALELAAGDWIGLRKNGSVWSVYHKTSAGSWTQLGSDVTDSTARTTGRIVLESNSAATALTRIQYRDLGNPSSPTGRAKFQTMMMGG